MNKGFGAHLTIDGRECNQDKLSSLEHIYKVLDELPVILGMTKIMPPYVFQYSGKIQADKGVTGFVIIAESHISIHTFTEKDHIFIDVFSCKPFDEKEALSYLLNAFEIIAYDFNCVTRGKHFPR